MSYDDTHRHRLGPNFQQIPVNRPLCPYANYQRDGFMAVDGNQGLWWYGRNGGGEKLCLCVYIVVPTGIITYTHGLFVGIYFSDESEMNVLV